MGKSANSQRIAQAVDDEEWQKFRLSMKGETTERKLQMLKYYYQGYYHDALSTFDKEAENINIRVDNYIKALCRGGQLHAGESLDTALEQEWKLRIKS